MKEENIKIRKDLEKDIDVFIKNTSHTDLLKEDICKRFRGLNKRLGSVFADNMDDLHPEPGLKWFHEQINKLISLL